MIPQLASGFMTLLIAKFMLNDLPHAVLGNPGNPTNPTSSMTYDIIARTGMKEYEYKYFPPPAEERPGRVYPYTRTKNIGPYSVVMTRSDGTCTIKLYEFLEGWRKKLRATWTGFEKPECEHKFEQVYEAAKQVRAEHIIEMRKALGG